ncbi:MAG TPA: cyclic nucleotide-binding domain-containing protein [Ilumatobacter sp.]|jgi:voltage-gated potassium channel|nr:cyclic nucleotide-binding domain-containing protein [Ilumatobacter sp.]
MKKNEYHEYLKRVPLFRDLDSRELDAVAAVVTDLRFDAGDVLIHQGASAHEMFIVTVGELEVTRDGEHIADLGPGTFAGEMAVLARTQRNSTVTAKSDVEVLHIDGRSMQTLFADVPEIAVKMLPVVAGRVVANSDHHSH